MVAMRNATDNAKDLTRDLTLSYNKTRQAQYHQRAVRDRIGRWQRWQN